LIGNRPHSLTGHTATVGVHCKCVPAAKIELKIKKIIENEEKLK